MPVSQSTSAATGGPDGTYHRRVRTHWEHGLSGNSQRVGAGRQRDGVAAVRVGGGVAGHVPGHVDCFDTTSDRARWAGLSGTLHRAGRPHAVTRPCTPVPPTGSGAGSLVVDVELDAGADVVDDTTVVSAGRVVVDVATMVPDPPVATGERSDPQLVTSITRMGHSDHGPMEHATLDASCR